MSGKISSGLYRQAQISAAGVGSSGSYSLAQISEIGLIREGKAEAFDPSQPELDCERAAGESMVKVTGDEIFCRVRKVSGDASI